MYFGPFGVEYTPQKVLSKIRDKYINIKHIQNAI